MPSQDAALLTYIQASHPGYFGKVIELREAVGAWLAYIPQTFPHYTSHTLQHSEEIVRQASNLLFEDGDSTRPTIQLSGVEAYSLVAAAYLHDAGMVASDGEKAKILASEEWRAWTTGEGGGAKRHREIHELRHGSTPPNENERNFLADHQLRFLIAEFIRRRHHFRAADVIEQHHYSLGRFAFDDPILQRTISDICVAHGLRQYELEDNERYPSRRDIRGECANVRLLAILLRLADLLDMANDRACPLLLNAACPLPADSYAHWTQYQRIIHRVTAPDRIELTAECHEENEHRLLHDWCKWIVEEVKAAQHATIRFERHAKWSVPLVAIDGSKPTITIRPSAKANYVPSSWSFELDQDTIFQRLIFDVYTQPEAFVRELIQNALDASRCSLYADMRAEGIEPPEYPTQVGLDRLKRYPIHVSIQSRQHASSLSGELECSQVVIVEDFGIGMDEDIIKRYLLQVGRSYYTTDEFRRSYRFVPASRFGVGFLSVFAVSDEVSIDTFKQGAVGGEPIHLKLTGPRNYLLREHSQRRYRGTKVEVTLRTPMESGSLTKLVSMWCKRVEFPVVVDDFGVTSTVRAERPEDFTYEQPDVTENGGTLAVRSFSLNVSGVQGEIYVFVRRNGDGESWADWGWAQYRYPDSSPQASRPNMPASIDCFHGIAFQQSDRQFARHPYAVRVDYRGEQARAALSRENERPRDGHWGMNSSGEDPQVVLRLEEIVSSHLACTPKAAGDSGWKYKQRLVKYFPLPRFWRNEPKMIPIHLAGKMSLLSLAEAIELPLLSVLLYLGKVKGALRKVEAALLGDDVEAFSSEQRAILFGDRMVSRIQWLHGSVLSLEWTRGIEGELVAGMNGPAQIAECPEDSVIGFAAHKSTNDIYEMVILNSRHAFVQWLRRAIRACSVGEYGLRKEQADTLLKLIDTPSRHGGHKLNELYSYLKGWASIPGLPIELCPPDLEIKPDMFILRSGLTQGPDHDTLHASRTGSRRRKVSKVRS